MTSWRVNEGLDPLLSEVRAAHPGIVIGTIGDAAHRAEKSDHNPNAAGRVNAADFMISTGPSQARAFEQRLHAVGRRPVVHDVDDQLARERRRVEQGEGVQRDG